MILSYQEMVQGNGFFESRRKEQALQAFTETVEESIRQKFYHDPNVASRLNSLQQEILSGNISPYAAARRLME
jgi:LAO/AO transport system kinase